MFTAMALIGVRVDRRDFEERLYQRANVKAFQHDYGQDMKFDPQTGKPLWKESQEPVDGWNEEDEQLFGYPVVDDGSEGKYKYICLYATGKKTDDNGGPYDQMQDVVLANLSVARNKMRKELEKLGLWSDKQFGLWAVLEANA